MGRSGQSARSTPAVAAPAPAPVSSEHVRLRMHVETLLSRVRRGSAGSFGRDPVLELRAQAAALGLLPPGQQVLLILAARDYEGPQQERVRANARWLFTLSHVGFVEQLIRRYDARG